MKYLNANIQYVFDSKPGGCSAVCESVKRLRASLCEKCVNFKALGAIDYA